MGTSGRGAVETARRLAAHVDRLFIGGHRAAGPYGAAVRRRLALSGPTGLIDLRRQLLRRGGLTFEEIAVKQRYIDRAAIERLLVTDVGAGLLVLEDGRYVPTGKGMEALAGFTEALQRGVGDLWGAQAESVRLVRSVLDGAIARAAGRLNREEYPAFFLEWQGTDAGDELLHFWSDLATLRYLRADAHALAWQERELDAGQIASLTILCHKEGPTCVKEVSEASPGEAERNLAALRQRGWVEREREKWRVTERGRRAREAIERRTDDFSAPPWEPLSAIEREQVVSFLSMLPDRANSGG